MYHFMPTSIPHHLQPYCSAEKSVEECLLRLPGNKELDWGKKNPKFETCLLGGLLLLSLPNSCVINKGFMLKPHQRRLLKGSVVQGLYFPFKKSCLWENLCYLNAHFLSSLQSCLFEQPLGYKQSR